jgi:hypothetical protein
LSSTFVRLADLPVAPGSCALPQYLQPSGVTRSRSRRARKLEAISPWARRRARLVAIPSGAIYGAMAATAVITPGISPIRFPLSGWQDLTAGNQQDPTSVGHTRLISQQEDAMEALRVPLRAVGRAALAAMFVTGGADAMLDPVRGRRARPSLECRWSRSWRSGSTAPPCWPPASPSAPVCCPGWPRPRWPAHSCRRRWRVTRTGVWPTGGTAPTAHSLLQERRPLRRGAAGAG